VESKNKSSFIVVVVESRNPSEVWGQQYKSLPVGDDFLLPLGKKLSGAFLIETLCSSECNLM